MRPTTTEVSSTRASQRAGSVRTALILGVVAVGSFGGIIFTQLFAPSAIWLCVLGAAVIGLPLAAMVGRGRAR